MRGCEFPSDDELLFDDEDLEEDAVSHPGGKMKKKHEGATMKIRWNSLRRLIREEIKRSGLLTEVACPVCGTEGAYVGLHDVECVNKKCKFYVPSGDVGDTAASPSTNIHQISFGFGPNSDFYNEHLIPYFDDGTITPYPGAVWYDVGYGELFAYDHDDNAIASWTTEVPNTKDDVMAIPRYKGRWMRL